MSKITLFPDYLQPAVSLSEQKAAMVQKTFYSTITNLMAEKNRDAISEKTNAASILDSIHAEFAVNSSHNNPAVKISVPVGNNKIKESTVFIKSIHADNATLSELFALCFYADSMGIGKNNWNHLAYYSNSSVQNGYSKDLSSINEFFFQRQDWNMIIAQMTIHFMGTGQNAQAAIGKELLAVIKYIESISAAEKESNWRTMNEKTWEKMLKSMDDAIDAWKERLKLLREAQMKAAGKLPSVPLPLIRLWQREPHGMLLHCLLLFPRQMGAISQSPLMLPMPQTA